MPFLWNANNLTDPSFVNNYLSPQDKNYALTTITSQQDAVKSKLDNDKVQFAIAEDQLTTGEFSFDKVKDARNLANAATTNPNLTSDQRAELQADYERLATGYTSLTAHKENLSREINYNQTQLDNINTSIENLESVGAVKIDPASYPAYTTPATPVTPPEANREQQTLLEANAAPTTQEDLNTNSMPLAEFGPDAVNNPVPKDSLASQEPITPEQQAFLDANAAPTTQEDLNTNSMPLAEFGPDAVYNNTETRGPGATSDITASPDTNDAAVNRQTRESGAASTTPYAEGKDYRVRISLAESANYLYKDPEMKKTDLLYPLYATNGVIYPYTPKIAVTHTASYQATDLAHSNFKMYNYSGSSVDSISITGEFTAQDVYEANYLLAVIHFFKSATKMFYGNDIDPIRGVPPPLVYLTGHGDYMFDRHPMVVHTFTMDLPDNVDYINATNNQVTTSYVPPSRTFTASKARLSQAKLQPGGISPAPVFTLSAKMPDATRVPTKVGITIQCYPIVTRDNISNNFSLKKYATGELLRGSKRKGGGIW